jgi:hypothetical protein
MTPGPEPLRHDPRQIGWLLAILVVAAGLRVLWLDYDLPQVVWVDAFKFVQPAAGFARDGTFQLVDHQYPGLYPLVLAGVFGALDLQSPYAQHLAAQAVAAVAGAATVLAIWIAAGAWCGTLGRVLAAGLCAVSPTLVTYARVPVSDGVVACFIAAAFAVLARAPGTWTAAAGAGAFVGLAAGSKLSGAQGLLLVLCALAARFVPYRELGRLSAHAAAAAVAGALAFWITTPWFLRDLDAYVRRLKLETLIQMGGQIGRVQRGAFDYLVSATPTWETPWLGTSLLGTEGPLVLLAAVAAVALALWRRPPPDALAGGAVFVLLMLALQAGGGKLKAIRFLAPLLPICFVLIGWAVEREMAPRLGRRRWVSVALAAALLAVPAARSARFLAMHARPSTHVLARAWIHDSLPPGTPAFLAPFYADDLDDGHLEVVRLADVGSRQYRFPEGIGPSAERDLLYAPELLDEIRQRGVEHLILNSYFDAAFSPVPENLAFFPHATAAYAAFRERLEREARLVYEVIGLREGRLGPDIAIYRLEPPPPGPGASRPGAGPPGRLRRAGEERLHQGRVVARHAQRGAAALAVALRREELPHDLARARHLEDAPGVGVADQGVAVRQALCGAPCLRVEAGGRLPAVLPDDAPAARIHLHHARPALARAVVEDQHVPALHP